MINGDALEVDVLAHLTPPVRVVANLPYNVGTELLIRWLTPADLAAVLGEPDADVPEGSGRAHRGQARASKAYGRLALLAQWRCDARIVLHPAARGLHPGAQGAFRRGASDPAGRAALSGR